MLLTGLLCMPLAFCGLSCLIPDKFTQVLLSAEGRFKFLQIN
jgi:hypothetical protein